MRVLADQLAAIARQVGDVGDRVHSKATHIEFEGPAARRFRTWAGDERRQAQQVENELQQLVQYLRREAQRIESAPKAKA
jgi:hypothetical protein